MKKTVRDEQVIPTRIHLGKFGGGLGKWCYTQSRRKVLEKPETVEPKT